MRNLLLSATIAAVAGLAPLSGAAFIERLPLQDVELQDLQRAPSAYLNTRVRFRATFIEQAQIYDPTHTPYTPERFVNLAVWDDEDAIYDPEVRARPVVTLYFDKERASASELSKLRKYDVIEITGDISSTARGLPWVSVHTLTRVDGAQRFNDNAIYHVEQAAALAKEGAHDLADARFASALAVEMPPSARIRVNELRARNQMAAGRFADAAGSLRTALGVIDEKREDTRARTVSTRDRANLHYLLAKALGESATGATGEAQKTAFTEAVAQAQRSLALDPSNGDAYAVLGIALAGLGRYDEARRECAQAIRLQPQNAEVRWYLGRILDSQGQHDEAIEALKKAIDLTPKDPRMHRAIASAYFHRGQKGGPNQAADIITALREYDIAVRLNPADADSYYEGALVIEAAAAAKLEVPTGEASAPATKAMALQRLEAGLKIDAKHIPTQLALAERYLAAGDTKKTIALYQQILEADPSRGDVLQSLVQVHLTLNQNAEALALLEAYRAKHPENHAVTLNYATVALGMGQAEKAAPALEQVTAAKPKHAVAQVTLAEAYLALGRKKDAVKRAKLAQEHGDAAVKAQAQAVLDKSR